MFEDASVSPGTGLLTLWLLEPNTRGVSSDGGGGSPWCRRSQARLKIAAGATEPTPVVSGAEHERASLEPTELPLFSEVTSLLGLLASGQHVPEDPASGDPQPGRQGGHRPGL